MSWLLIVCSTGWHDCQFEGRVPREQCKAMISMAMAEMPVICVSERGEVVRSQIFTASK